MEAYKDKEYATGFPPHVVTEEQKDAHVEETSRLLGLEMDKAKFVRNEALRNFSKFKINNFVSFKLYFNH